MTHWVIARIAPRYAFGFGRDDKECELLRLERKGPSLSFRYFLYLRE